MTADRTQAQRKPWLEPLQVWDIIVEMARDIHDARSWNMGKHSENSKRTEYLLQKYPAGNSSSLMQCIAVQSNLCLAAL